MASPEGDPASISCHAPRVGAELRAVRLRYGWELPQVAQSLRIRAAYLEAIEAGRVSDLPGNAYAIGFLRTYATALGLDADEMSRRFRAEVAEVNTKTELTFPAPVPERGVPAGAVIFLGVVVAVGAYAGWYHFAERAAAPGAVPPPPPKLARLAEPTVMAPAPIPAGQPPAAPALPATAIPAAPGTGSGATNPTTPPPATSPETAGAGTPAAPAALADESAPNPTAAGNAPSPATPRPPGAATEAATAPAAGAASPAAETHSGRAGAALTAVAAIAPPAQAAQAPPALAGTIVVKVTAESWVEVKDSTGAVIFTKLMQPGESWTAPREAGLTLTTGNAGGTELVVDGTIAASLGGPGEVERNQPLDAALIKSGALPAQIAAAAAPDATHPNLRLMP